MNKTEIQEFIEKMGEIGDTWTEEQVEDVYGDTSLETAVAERQSSIGKLTGIIDTIINR